MAVTLLSIKMSCAAAMLLTLHLSSSAAHPATSSPSGRSVKDVPVGFVAPRVATD